MSTRGSKLKRPAKAFFVEKCFIRSLGAGSKHAERGDQNWLVQFKELIIPCFTKEIIVEAKSIINDYTTLIDVNNTSDQADPYLIAIAKLNNYTILTNERYGEGGKKAKIPFICKKLGIECKNIKEFYIEEKWKF
ncbi:MAG: DUF4411 family protein [Candidatus Levyibacteriota bacterium]